MCSNRTGEPLRWRNTANSSGCRVRRPSTTAIEESPASRAASGRPAAQAGGHRFDPGWLHPSLRRSNRPSPPGGAGPSALSGRKRAVQSLIEALMDASRSSGKGEHCGNRRWVRIPPTGGDLVRARFRPGPASASCIENASELSLGLAPATLATAPLCPAPAGSSTEASRSTEANVKTPQRPGVGLRPSQAGHR